MKSVKMKGLPKQNLNYWKNKMNQQAITRKATLAKKKISNSIKVCLPNYIPSTQNMNNKSKAFTNAIKTLKTNTHFTSIFK